MKDKTLIDVLLICKGWYNKEQYSNVLVALNAYYHKFYGCEDIIIDKSFALHLFLKPLVLKAIEIDSSLTQYIFEESCSFHKNKLFNEEMYDRCLKLIINIKHDTFDLSAYQDMFDKLTEKDYVDNTIGII